ncbi:MAG TPA: hypothetical protein VGJ95_14670 [Pseudonocardiaceae bacterium]|jgi:hypothetical protein
MTRKISTDAPVTVDQPMKGTTTMLLHEALARSRMREAQQAARDHRMARQITAGRNWQRLARWSARRAEKARSGR